MIRKGLTIVSLVGLLLSVGAWVASYFNVQYRRARAEVVFHDGFAGIRAGCLQRTPHRVWEIFGYQGLDTRWSPKFHRAHAPPGGGYDSQSFYFYAPNQGNGWMFLMPLWIPVVLFTGLVGVMRISNRNCRRRKLGLCVKCGYDLRASTERCPECGTPFESKIVTGNEA